jgi:hypothetical protein
MWQSQLLPLHLTIYERLATEPWLLQRTDRMKVLSDFVLKTGDVFVSGDYESATDNLNSLHSKRLLSGMFATASHVPVGIQLSAISSLTGYVRYEDTLFQQRTGQLMGNYLSFPLLCLMNFCTVVHAMGWDRATNIPLKINGDDIVFRCTPLESERWSNLVRDSGLVLSRGKTLVHHRFFSINSTFFQALRFRPKLVKSIRLSTYLKAPRSPSSMASQLKAVLWGFHGKMRTGIASRFLKRNYACVVKGPSITRGLGLDFPPECLKDAGLMSHELGCLELPEVVDVVHEQAPNCATVFKRMEKICVTDLCRRCLSDARSQMKVANNVIAFSRIPKKEKEKKSVVDIRVSHKKVAMRLLIKSCGKTNVIRWMRAKGKRVVDLVWGRSSVAVRKKREFVWADPLDLPSCRCSWLLEYKQPEFVVGSSLWS